MARAENSEKAEKLEKLEKKRRLFGKELPTLEPGQASQLVGLVAAVAVALLLNVLVATRYSRWDWTSNKRYSLSAATLETLRDLPSGVRIWVLLGPADPLEQSVKQLLVAYQAETTKLEVRYVDPDKDVVALEDVRKRFRIETGRTEQGHVVADAVVVVERGEKHWFLGPSDLIEVARGDDTRVKPKEEQAVTSAIRNVLGGSKTRVCFTTGHGEMSLTDAGDRGLGVLRDVLEKDNYEVTSVDLGAPGVAAPFGGCGVAVVAGMRGAFTTDETERLRTWLMGGGNALLAVSPVPGDTPTGLVPAGLERVLAPFGVALDEDLVIEADEERAFAGQGGIRFVAEPKPHPVTASLVKGEGQREVPRVVLHFTRSMRSAQGEGGATAVALLGASAKAFGLTNLTGAADWKDTPQKRPGDLGGPLVLAMASERPKVAPDAPHGPRLVVLGTPSGLTAASLREPLPVRGAAMLAESAISWLAAKPQVLDIPDKSAVAAGMRITDDSRSDIRRYVLMFMPGAFALAGLVIAFVRRAGEGAPRKGEPKPGKRP